MGDKIPTPERNPKGLHRKYIIKKYAGTQPSAFGWTEEPIYEDVDDDSEYFVMRLDGFGGDKIHTDACRKAVLYYAELIKDHLPELSNDLIKRYGK